MTASLACIFPIMSKKILFIMSKIGEGKETGIGNWKGMRLDK